MKNKKPSFIIFMTDQQRADHLGCYGNLKVKTPNIDAIANRGTRFDHFYVSNPICQPNRAALATGQLTSVNGCRQNGIPLSLDSTTYADVLRSSGYRTGLVGKAHFQNVSPIELKSPQPSGEGEDLNEPYNLASKSQRRGSIYECEIRTSWKKNPKKELPLPYYGFDYVQLCIGHGDQVEGHYTDWLKGKLSGQADPRGRSMALDKNAIETPQVWRTALSETQYPTQYVGEKACEFLEDQDDTPFILVVSFPDPHHPFTPPGRYFDLYDPTDISLPESFNHPIKDRSDLPKHIQRIYEIGAEKPDEFWPFHADEEHTRQMIALNYGAITMIDDQIGVVIQTLKNIGQFENTNIIFMSDHGDYMGDHGTVLKGGVHSHGLIRVPLIWSDPQSYSDKISKIQGSAIDFAPTLLHKAGLKTPYGMQGRNLFAGDVKNLPILIEDSGYAMASDDGQTAYCSIVHNRWRMTIFEGSELGELFNLEEDPYELTNLWFDSAASSKKLEMMHLLIDRQIALRSKSLAPTHQA